MMAVSEHERDFKLFTVTVCISLYIVGTHGIYIRCTSFIDERVTDMNPVDSDDVLI